MKKGSVGNTRHSLPTAEDHKRRLNTCYEGVQVELDVKRYSLQPRMHLIKRLKNPGWAQSIATIDSYCFGGEVWFVFDSYCVRKSLGCLRFISFWRKFGLSSIHIFLEVVLTCCCVPLFLLILTWQNIIRDLRGLIASLKSKRGWICS